MHFDWNAQRGRATAKKIRHAATVAVASVLATLIAMGILTAVTGLFQGRGMPLEELAAAERACAGRAYVSERATCMREWVAAAHRNQVARR